MINCSNLILLLLIISCPAVFAAKPVPAVDLECTVTELGNAVINEVNTTDNFVEIYLLAETDILDWGLYIDDTQIASLGNGSCEINGTAQLDNTSAGATTTTWTIGTYITCDFNLNPSNDEVLLVDKSTALSDGDTTVIDYLGYGNLTKPKWTVDAACGTLYPGHSAGNKDIARIPDGTGGLSDNGDDSTKGTPNDPPPTGVDHYEIHHDGTGLTCLAEPITVYACETADCSSLSASTITAILSIGASNQAITITTGSLVTNFDYTAVGTATVSLSSLSEAATVDCYINNILDANCEITFADSGFVFDVPTLSSCKPSADVTIKAVKKSDVSTQCVGALTGTQTINFWSTYLVPNSGGKPVNISGTNVATSSPGTGVNLSFDINGEATFIAQYDDAGQVQLNAQYSGANGLALTGSDSFVAAPVALAVYSDDTNADCASNDASCSKFKKAGETFNLNVNAACWTDDADTDFTDNPVTPNFALSSIINNHSLIAPAGGINGNLNVGNFDFATSDAGIHTISQAVSEVGVFTFGVTPPSYLGEILVTAISPSIGRFYPDHFQLTTVTDGAFGANACTGFSYSGQTFTYQTQPQLKVTAYNAASTPAITQNYTGSFAKLITTNFNITSPTTDATQLGTDGINLVGLSWTAVAASLVDNADGSLTFSFGNDSYRYLHEANSLIDEFTNAVDLIFTAITDSDLVASQGLPYTLQPTGEDIRFGRLDIANAHGSELAPLAVAITAEYFNGVDWTDNTADQCTILNLATHLQLANPDTASGVWQVGNTTMTIGGGNTTGTLTNNNPLLLGEATLTFSAPGEDNLGYVDIQSQLTGLFDWLLSDSDNDGVYDNEATGRASFGIFSGSDNIIFKREVY
ncbi:MAG: DUF6701 domain-containing protein [Methylophagaceae bacterium]